MPKSCGLAGEVVVDRLHPAALELLGEGGVVGLTVVVDGHPAVEVVPTRRSGRRLGLDVADLGSRAQGGVQEVVGLDLLGEELGRLVEDGRRQVVDRVGQGVVHHCGVGHVRAHRVARYRGQVAALAGGFGRLVQGETLAHQHEVRLAGLLHHRRHVRDGRVLVVTDDLAAVDPALGVAPLDHGRDRIAHLLVQARRTGEAPVIAIPDADARVGDTLIGGARGVTRAAGRGQRAERL